MECKILRPNNQKELTDLFKSVFTSSEGAEEGQRIGKLVSELSLGIDDRSIICFGSYLQGSLVGSIFFTRLQFQAPTQVFMLAPVAVREDHQGKGIGQALIKHGLGQLRERNIEIVVTYGDPSFYSKVGFRALSESVIQAPYTLSRPEGWLAQSLSDQPIPRISERPSCVKEFRDSALW